MPWLVDGVFVYGTLMRGEAVELNPQIPVLAVTHWVPLSRWHVELPNHCFL